jgi:hypothetical protein
VHPGYYAFFFCDPDGVKVEVVHVPGRPQTAAELAALSRCRDDTGAAARLTLIPAPGRLSLNPSG